MNTPRTQALPFLSATCAPSQPPTAPQNVPPPPPVNRGSQPNISGAPDDKKAADAKPETPVEKKSN